MTRDGFGPPEELKVLKKRWVVKESFCRKKSRWENAVPLGQQFHVLTLRGRGKHDKREGASRKRAIRKKGSVWCWDNRTERCEGIV